MFCDNSDHDGEPVPATAVIIMDETRTATARCTYCAEGFMTALVRLGADFRVRATAHEPAEPVASAPVCDCSCHTTPGVMHVAACCSTGLTAHENGSTK